MDSSKTFTWEAVIRQAIPPVGNNRLRHDLPLKDEIKLYPFHFTEPVKKEVLLFLCYELIYGTAQCWPVTHGDKIGKTFTLISRKSKLPAGINVVDGVPFYSRLWDTETPEQVKKLPYDKWERFLQQNCSSL